MNLEHPEFCIACNLTVNSVEQLRQHYLGKKHLKNLAVKDEVNTDTVTVPPTSSPATEGKKKKKKKKKKTSITFVREGDTSCTPVQYGVTNDEPLGFDIDQVLDADKPGDDAIQPTRKRKAEESFCDICNKFLNSPAQLESHYSSAKHLKKTKLSLSANNGLQTDEPLGFDIDLLLDADKPGDDAIQPTRKRKAEESFCDCCNKVLNSPTQLESHYSSAKHLKKSKLSLAVNNVTDGSESADVVDNKMIVGSPPLSPLPESDLTSQTVVLPPSSDNDSDLLQEEDESDNHSPNPTHGLMFCSFCNMGMNSQSQIDAHRSGARHKKNVAKAKGQPVSSTTV